MTTGRAPIGVFDSGVGGLSTLGALIRELPHEDFIFFADTAYAPYGTKTKAQVLERVECVTEQLMHDGAKAIVIACNTATACAAAELRERLTLPVIGIEPALKPASLLRSDGQVAVLATPVTLSLPKFGRLMERFGEGAVPVPCPGLMELVEQEDLEGAGDYVLRRLAACAPGKLDAVVLGCTHYVFLRPVLRRLLPGSTAIVDGNAGTARQLRRVLEANALLTDSDACGQISLRTSGDPERVRPLMERMLKRATMLDE